MLRAEVLYARGELKEAMRLFKEQECICWELGNKDSLSVSLGSQATILSQKGQLKDAVLLAKEAYKLAIESGQTDLVKQIKELEDLCSQLEEIEEKRGNQD